MLIIGELSEWWLIDGCARERKKIKTIVFPFAQHQATQRTKVITFCITGQHCKVVKLTTTITTSFTFCTFSGDR